MSYSAKQPFALKELSPKKDIINKSTLNNWLLKARTELAG
jgi:hypothetical protein